MAMTTHCFNMVEQDTIGVSHTVTQGLLVFIHTLVHSAMVVTVLWHEVSIVLPGPGGRAAGIITTVGLVDT